MKLQMIQDDRGKAIGGFIPIKDWKQLKRQNIDLEYEEPSSKEQILQELKEAVIELSLIQKGKLKARPSKELLN